MSLEAPDQQVAETTTGSGGFTTANSGWFSSLFGWFAKDNSIPNVNSNGSDVPLADYGSASKYSLPFWGGQDGGAVNAAPPSDQGFFAKIWNSSTAKFIFCPIFRDCPEGVPPGGYTPVEDTLSAAGKAVGNGASAALGPILPVLIVLAAILLLANILLPRLLGATGGAR